VVGLGPGHQAYLTPKALQVLQEADVVIGYKTYIDLIEHLLSKQTVLAYGMKKEVQRAQEAVAKALAGYHVAVISSGDPGVYGMAGLVLEVAPKDLPVEIIPGVTAASSAAAALGAPLVHDFAVISLSDLLTSWEIIVKRLEAAAATDFVIVLYNPRSRGRQEHLRQALRLVQKYRSGETPAGFVKNSGRPGETAFVGTLATLPVEEVDMSTTVIIGNSQTKIIQGKMVTPRGYAV